MNFSKYQIKQYDLWDLFLHKSQFPYIGRCYALARRKDAEKVTDISTEELMEMFRKVVPEWNRAISMLFKHDWPNVTIFGNESPHLHADLIPGYNGLREFCEVKFRNQNQKGNCLPCEKKKLEEEILQEIKHGIMEII